MEHYYRTCQNCGKLYRLGQSGSGYKYCCRHCAKTAQMKQIAKWEAENKMTVQEWRNFYETQQQIEEFENRHIASTNY